MANLKYSCISLGLGLLVILFSQVIATSPTEQQPPVCDESILACKNSIDIGEFEESGKTINTIIPDDLSNEPKYYGDISFQKFKNMPPEPEIHWMALYRAKNSKKNHAKVIPGTRRLLNLKDFGADIKSS